jgi:Lar family restriction alleviation protein
MTDHAITQQLSMLSLTGLLPCPFCGSISLTRVSRQETTGVITPLCIHCDACGATGPTAETHDKLSALWDVRAAIGRPL